MDTTLWCVVGSVEVVWWCGGVLWCRCGVVVVCGGVEVVWWCCGVVVGGVVVCVEVVWWCCGCLLWRCYGCCGDVVLLWCVVMLL